MDGWVVFLLFDVCVLGFGNNFFLPPWPTSGHFIPPPPGVFSVCFPYALHECYDLRVRVSRFRWGGGPRRSSLIGGDHGREARSVRVMARFRVSFEAVACWYIALEQ